MNYTADMLFIITNYLSYRDIANSMLICKQFYVVYDNYRWHTLLLRDFPLTEYEPSSQKAKAWYVMHILYKCVATNIYNIALTIIDKEIKTDIKYDATYVLLPETMLRNFKPPMNIIFSMFVIKAKSHNYRIYYPNLDQIYQIVKNDPDIIKQTSRILPLLKDSRQNVKSIDPLFIKAAFSSEIVYFTPDKPVRLDINLSIASYLIYSISDNNQYDIVQTIHFLQEACRKVLPI